jgi:hypothetical protein
MQDPPRASQAPPLPACPPAGQGRRRRRPAGCTTAGRGGASAAKEALVDLHPIKFEAEATGCGDSRHANDDVKIVAVAAPDKKNVLLSNIPDHNVTRHAMLLGRSLEEATTACGNSSWRANDDAKIVAVAAPDKKNVLLSNILDNNGTSHAMLLGQSHEAANTGCGNSRRANDDTKIVAVAAAPHMKNVLLSNILDNNGTSHGGSSRSSTSSRGWRFLEGDGDSILCSRLLKLKLDYDSLKLFLRRVQNQFGS